MTRILVVDDEEPIRRLVSSYLSDEGFEVEELTDGQAAVERIGRTPGIDLVVMDVRMPRLNGIDAEVVGSVGHTECPSIEINLRRNQGFKSSKISLPFAAS